MRYVAGRRKLLMGQRDTATLAATSRQRRRTTLACKNRASMSAGAGAANERSVT
jgi:hypothetical protein